MEPDRKRWKASSRNIDSWNAVPVLSDELYADVELINALAAPILDKKQTSKLIQELNTKLPLTTLPHLKRVRKTPGSSHALDILLLPIDQVNKPKSLDCSNAKETLLDSSHPGLGLDSSHLGLGLDSSHPGLGLDFSHLGPDLDSYSALGRFFVVKIPLRAPLTRAQFKAASEHWPTSFHEDKSVAAALCSELFDSEQKQKIQSFMLSAIEAAKEGRRRGMEAVGAVMVDPKSDKIIAKSHDCRNNHPLHHATMTCIDLVARSQGGGRYSYEEYECCEFDSRVLEGSYICTGLDLYVTREPCVLCAMALVHSRVGRVFYGIGSEDGALGSKFKIHALKDLNHRFDVFKGVLARQCHLLDIKCEDRDGIKQHDSTDYQNLSSVSQ